MKILSQFAQNMCFSKPWFSFFCWCYLYKWFFLCRLLKIGFMKEGLKKIIIVKKIITIIIICIRRILSEWIWHFYVNDSFMCNLCQNIFFVLFLCLFDDTTDECVTIGINIFLTNIFHFDYLILCSMLVYIMVRNK